MSTNETTYPVEGMTCQGCVRGLETALARALPAVKAAVAVGSVTVTGEHDAKAVRAAIESAGFDTPESQ